MWWYGIIPSFVLTVLLTETTHVRARTCKPAPQASPGDAGNYSSLVFSISNVFGCLRVASHVPSLPVFACFVSMLRAQQFAYARPVEFLWLFSEVLEPLALVPQLVVFRGCTDAGRLPCKQSSGVRWGGGDSGCRKVVKLRLTRRRQQPRVAAGD